MLKHFNKTGLWNLRKHKTVFERPLNTNIFPLSGYRFLKLRWQAGVQILEAAEYLLTLQQYESISYAQTVLLLATKPNIHTRRLYSIWGGQ